MPQSDEFLTSDALRSGLVWLQTGDARGKDFIRLPWAQTERAVVSTPDVRNRHGLDLRGHALPFLAGVNFCSGSGQVVLAGVLAEDHRY